MDSDNHRIRKVIDVNKLSPQPLAVSLSDSTSGNTPIQVILMGSGAIGRRLTYSVVHPPANGVLSGTAPIIIYTPATGFTGLDSFTFEVNDGSANSNVATVWITVFPVPALGDGKFTIAFATMMLQWAVNLGTPTAAQAIAADVNGNGKIDIGDVTLILKAIVNGTGL